MFLAVLAAVTATSVSADGDSSLVTVTKWNVDNVMRQYNCVILSFCADWKKDCKQTVRVSALST